MGYKTTTCKVLRKNSCSFIVHPLVYGKVIFVIKITFFSFFEVLRSLKEAFNFKNKIIENQFIITLHICLFR